MYKGTATIVNPTGLHARPAADFVSLAKSFVSDIQIKDLTTEEAAVNAKSIIRVLTLGLSKGKHVEISASGDDETEAVSRLIALIQSGFGE